MADLSRSFTGYTQDDGTVYKVQAETFITAQGKLGEATLVGTETELPKTVTKRYATVKNAANKVSRKVTIYSPTASIIPAGQTINLYTKVSGALTSAVFVSNGKFQSERHARANARP